MSTALMLHRGSRLVDTTELAAVPTPPATETWFPLPHVTVLDSALTMLGDAGFQVSKTQLALSSNNARFFAVLDLNNGIADGVSLSVGIRNSIDKSLPIGFAAGTRVWVCDNLAFAGDKQLSRKHTRFGRNRFVEAMALAVQGLTQFQAKEQHRIGLARDTMISDIIAEAFMLRAYDKGIVSNHQLPKVIQEWREPTYPDFSPRSLWSLENAFTEALKPLAASNPQAFCGRTIALQGLLSGNGFPMAV
jgi:hypothetical protein